MKRGPASSKNGVAMLEFAMVFPIYLMALLCFLQLVLIMHARFMLHYAAFLAARAGIVYNARMEDMEWAACAAIAPHFARIQNGKNAFNSGMSKAQTELSNGDFSVEIIEPANAQSTMFNGNTIATSFAAQNRNLRVRVNWNYPMYIPVANSLFSGWVNNVPMPDYPGFQPGEFLGGGANPGNDPRMPIFAEYYLRMTHINPNSPYHA